MKKVIPTHNLDYLTKKLAKLSRKAAQLNLDDVPMLKIIGEVEPYKHIDPNTNKTRYIPMTEIEITGAAPKVKGWQFIGTINHHQNGNVVKLVPGLDKDFPQYHAGKPVCDHCQTRRARKDTYIVSNGTESMTVGRTCLKDFTGHMSPEYYANLCSLLCEVEEMLPFCDDNTPREKTYEDTFFTLWVAAAIVKMDEGYRSYKHWEHSCTANKVRFFISYSFSESREAQELRRAIQDYMTDETREAAQAALAWIREQPESKNTFFNNMRVVAGNDYLNWADIGILCYLLEAYKIAQEKAAEQKEALKMFDPAKSEHFGQIKKRGEMTLKYMKSLCFDSFYGDSWIHQFVTPEGNLAIWRSSKSPSEFGEPDKWEEIKAKATIKDHTEYRGTKQTVITRLALVG